MEQINGHPIAHAFFSAKMSHPRQGGYVFFPLLKLVKGLRWEILQHQRDATSSTFDGAF